MSTKRKRVSELAAAKEGSPAATQTPKRRRAAAQANNDKTIEQLNQAQEIYEALRGFKQDGRLICEHFIRAPSRRSDPEYYKAVSSPIDLTRIQQKLKTEEYASLDAFCHDVQLLIDNALGYYKSDSVEHSDAQRLQEVFEAKRDGADVKPNGRPSATPTPVARVAAAASPAPSSHVSGRSVSPAGSSSMGAMPTCAVIQQSQPVAAAAAATPATPAGPVPVTQAVVEDAICSLLELTDDTGRLLSPPFRLLKSREEFPTYYEKIAHPIDLKTIAEKTRAGCYELAQQLEADVKLLCKNAKDFNESGTTIHKDAVSLLRTFMQKRRRMAGRTIPQNRQDHCTAVIDGLLAQTEASDGGDDFSEDSEEDEDSEESTDPLWRLYWKIRNEPEETDDSVNLADPFLELPQKSYYPDYYDEIARPMSLFMINKKLKRGDYKTLEQLMTDVILVVDNACSYNLEGSEIYVAAKRVEQLALQTCREIQPAMDLTRFTERVLPEPSDDSSPTPAPAPVKTPRPKTAKIKKEMLEESSGGEESRSDGCSPAPTSTPDSTRPAKKKSPKKMKPLSTTMDASLLSTGGKPGRKSFDELMLRYRLRLKQFWDLVYNFKEGDTYWPAGAFMTVPSEAEYPEYYRVIERPIDLQTILKNIENNQYKQSPDLIADFGLMFANARQFNEPRSQLYEDANKLETMLRQNHDTAKDTPVESPVLLREKFGWLRTKLPPKKKARLLAAGELAGVNSSFCTDDDASNSSIRTVNLPKGQRAPKTPKTPAATSGGQSGRMPDEQKKMWLLFNGIKEYKDDAGKKLAAAFLKLPSRQEYPDYYEVIKKPIDFQRVHQRLNGQGYPSLVEIVADFNLMFDNACKFNEPDSQIYKDAISLQSAVLEKRRELGSDDESMPRVQVECRAAFMQIFVAVFTKKDNDGRCYSDSLADLPDLLRAKGIPHGQWPFTLDQIKRNIDKCRYRRLDRFQKDFFDLFDTVRDVCRSDSQMFEDATELQLAFVNERDHLCKGLIVSNVYNFNDNEVYKKQDAARKNKEKAEKEADRKADKEAEIVKQEGEVDLSEWESDGVSYSVPCYVYVAASEDGKKGERHIMRLERLFTNDSGQTMARGRWCYRPNETFHLATRKFMQNEVFLTNFHDTVTADRLRGKCLVQYLKTWTRYSQTTFPEEDVWLCESRYLGKQQYFKKIKMWPYPEEEDEVEMAELDEPRTVQRVALESVEGAAVEEEEDDEKSQQSMSSEEDERLRDGVILDIERDEVAAKQTADGPDADGRTYFQQIITRGGKHHSIGQCVLVFNPGKATCDVMRIDRLWREKDGSEWFSGGWFARPSDVQHDPGRTFYRREVFAVIQGDQTRRVDDIQSHCAVLQSKDFVRIRPTEIPECDVFVCELRVRGKPMQQGEVCSLLTGSDDDNTSDEPQMQIEFSKPMRKMKEYKRSDLIAEDELFVFKQPITMEKEMSPLVVKNDVPLDALDDLDESQDDTTSNDGEQTYIKKESISTQWLAAQPKLNAKSKSGYILFSAEIRKRIMHENPEAGFGEVSKIVGIEWKKLNDEQKRQYEVRADYIANERAKQEAEQREKAKQMLPGQLRIHQCRWLNCDAQCESPDAMWEHVVAHTSHIIVDSEQQFVCMWHTCLRNNRKDGKPFPSLPRLHRHLKEKHLPASERVIYPNQRAKNFFRLCIVQNEHGQQSQQLVCFPYGNHPNQQQQPPAMQHQQGGHHQQAHHHQGHAMHPQQGHSGMNGHHDPRLQPQHHQGEQQPHYPQTPHHHAPPSMQHHTPHPQYAGGGGGAHPGHGQPVQVPAPQQASQGGMHAAAYPPGGAMSGAGGASDPARTVVQAARSSQLEPVFVAAPNSVHSRRVLHSETYLRYIESLSTRQRTVSKYERSLTARPRQLQMQNGQRLPTSWIKDVGGGRAAAKEEDVTRALWKLRDQILESTVSISIERDYVGAL